MTAFTVKSSFCLMAGPFQIFIHEATHQGGDISVTQLKMKSCIEISFMYSQSHMQIMVVKMNKEKYLMVVWKLSTFLKQRVVAKPGHTHMDTLTDTHIPFTPQLP